MSEYELKQFQQILKYFPLVGVSITKLATAINANATTLYNYRNGLIPKREKYLQIMEQIKNHFPKEFEKIGLFIQIDQKVEQGEIEWGTI